MKLCTILATISLCIGLLLCSYIEFVLNQPANDENVVLREITTNFLAKYFSNDQIFVSIIILPSERDQNRDFLYSLFNNQASMEFSYNSLEKLDNTTRDNRNPFNLIVVDDSKQLRDALNGSNVGEIHLNQKFLIVVTGNSLNNTNTLDEVFTTLWENGLVNSHVLIQDAANVWSLYTFLPYQRDCIALSHLKIESFTESNFSHPMNLPIDQVYPQKLKNFNGCPMYIAPKLYGNPTVMLVNTLDGKPHYEGIEVSIVDEVSKALNFTLKYKDPSKDTEFVEMVMQGEANLSIGGHTNANKEHRELLSISDPYKHSFIVFAYKEKSSLETMRILTAPFSNPLWLTIICILYFSILIILLTKMLPRKWRHFYIGGRMNRTAILNSYAVTFGQAIANPHIAHGRTIGNFARTLTIFWILLWFFVRSFYEGALFNVLQGQTTSTYDTIEKVLASDCKVFCVPNSCIIFTSLIPKNRIKAINLRTDIMLRDFHDNDDDGVAISSELTLDYWNMLKKPRRLSYTKNRLFMTNTVFFFRKKSILTALFNGEFLKLRQSGLISYWYSKYVDNRRITSKQRTSSNLQLETIYAVLQICAAMYIFSFAVFALEVLSTKFHSIKYILDFFTY